MHARRVHLNLCGLDGNAYCLMGAFRKQARREDWPTADIDAVIAECKSGDYDHLLATLTDHCDMHDQRAGDDSEETE